MESLLRFSVVGPTLFGMERAPLLYETHMHTPLCKHAAGEPEEYARAAIRRNFKGIIVTCHNPYLDDSFSASVRMSEKQFPEYVAMVERAAVAMAGQCEVYLGMECDYFPGHEPYLEKLLKSASFHHVLGSVHSGTGEYRARYDTSPLALQRQYFVHLADAAETRLFDTISHPDLVKNVHPESWDLDRVMPDIERALDRIAKTGVAMEFNTSGKNKAISEFNPNQPMLREIAERGIPIVLGSDAHTPERVGADWEEALDLIALAGFKYVSYFLARKRHDVPVAQAKASLAGVQFVGAES